MSRKNLLPDLLFIFDKLCATLNKTMKKVFCPMLLLPRPELNVRVPLGPYVAFSDGDSRDLGAAYVPCATLIMSHQDVAAIP